MEPSKNLWIYFPGKNQENRSFLGCEFLEAPIRKHVREWFVGRLRLF